MYPQCVPYLNLPDESPYILNDEDYLLKYRAELRTAVLKAKTSPRALLRGYNVCIAAHVQPPARTLSAIVKSAGGEVSWKSSLKSELLSHSCTRQHTYSRVKTTSMSS